MHEKDLRAAVKKGFKLESVHNTQPYMIAKHLENNAYVTYTTLL